MSLKKNILSSLGVQIFNLIISFVINIMLSRALKAQGQGELAYFTLIFGTIANYIHLGMYNSIPEFLNKRKIDENYLFNIDITISLILGAIGIILVGILGVAAGIFKGYSSTYIILGCIYILVMLLQYIGQYFFVAKEKVYITNKIQFLSNLFRFIIVILMYISGTLSIINYLILFVGVNIFIVVVSIIKLKLRYIPKLDLKIIKSQIGFGLFIFTANFFVFLNYRVDQFFIESNYGKANLGIYALAVSLSELIFVIPTSIGTALWGNLYTVIDDENKTKNLIEKILRYTLWTCIFISIIGCFLAELVPYFYGIEFTRSIYSIRILFLGTVLASIAKVGSSFLVVKGRMKSYVLITALTLLINIVFNFMLLPIFNIEGAAIASAISYTFYGISYLFILKFKDKISIKDIILLKREDLKLIKNINVFRRK